MLRFQESTIELPLSLWFITESDFVITIKSVENTVDYGAANYKYRLHKVTNVNDGLLSDVDNDGAVTPSGDLLMISNYCWAVCIKALN